MDFTVVKDTSPTCRVSGQGKEVEHVVDSELNLQRATTLALSL